MLKERNIAFVNSEKITGDDIFDIVEKNGFTTIYLVGPNLHFYGRLKELGRTPVLVSSIEDLPAGTHLYYQRPSYWATFLADGAVDQVTYATNSLRATERLLGQHDDRAIENRIVRPITITQGELPQPFMLMIDEMSRFASPALESIFDPDSRRLDSFGRRDRAQQDLRKG